MIDSIIFSATQCICGTIIFLIIKNKLILNLIKHIYFQQLLQPKYTKKIKHKKKHLSISSISFLCQPLQWKTKKYHINYYGNNTNNLTSTWYYKYWNRNCEHTSIGIQQSNHHEVLENKKFNYLSIVYYYLQSSKLNHPTFMFHVDLLWKRTKTTT